MSDVDRAELRRLLEEAHSKLPWRVDFGIIYGAPYEREGGGYLLTPTVADPDYGEDSELIAAAVNALPGLLDALEKAEAAIERVRELHTPGDEWCNLHDSALCECADVYCEACGDSWPCPTILALDGPRSELSERMLRCPHQTGARP